MEQIVEKFLQNCHLTDGYYHGFIDGSTNLDSFLEKYRQCTGIFFAIEHNRSRKTDASSHFSEASRPLFNLSGKVPIDFCGIPFTSEGTTVKSCMFGKDTKAAAKQKKIEKEEENTIVGNDHHYLKKNKSKSRIQVSKKKDCPAKLTIKEDEMYPDYKN